MKVLGTVMSVMDRGGTSAKGSQWRMVTLQFSEKPGEDRLNGEIAVNIDRDQTAILKNPKALVNTQVELALKELSANDYGVQFTGAITSKIPESALKSSEQMNLAGAPGK